MNEIICGVDEVGRGSLAGDVYASAVVLDPKITIDGIKDSKKLTANKREYLYKQITQYALSYAVGYATVIEIDKLNILNATMLAMQRAVAALTITPTRVLVDGNKTPNLAMSAQAIIGGDLTIKEIAAASIVAKVTRDREMILLDKQYPNYFFAMHKGYGTIAHFAAIKEYGITEIHRKSFNIRINHAKL